MARRVREYPWHATALGPIDTWPACLKTIVDLVLPSGFATGVLWGKHFIQIYNDGYADLIGAKHPDALGRPAPDSWPEFWPMTAPVVEKVLTGETCVFPDTRLSLPRRGVPEERWFTTAYSPLRDEKGEIAGVLVTMLETTERARSEAALRESESRLRLALEVAELGTWTWNLETGAGDLDARASEIVGLPSGPVSDLDELHRAFVHSEDLARVRAEATAGSATGEPFSISYRVVRADGSVRHVLSRARGLLDGDGGPVRIVGTTRDVTVERGIEEQRERFLADATAARAEADQADRAKDQFLITLSHELRTPLASILLWSRALRSGSFPPQDFNRAIEAIVVSAESQLQLIEDLVDLTRLKSGLVQLDRQSHSIEEVARDALQVVGPGADAKKLTLELGCAPDVGDAVFDRGRYQQVLINLLSNAVKFTPENGRVSLQIRKDAGQIEAVVADTGQGIDADFLPHLFQRFRRADMREKRRYGGLGVGLALSRHLVELHGGTIEGRSDGPGRGATFTVRIPWVPPEPAPRPSGAPAAGLERPLASLKGLRVLIVEDDDNMRDIMRWTLEGAGAQVLAVGSGNDALSMIEVGDRTNTAPDVLVCDLGLPGMSGYELMERIVADRRARRQKGIPACAVSAFVRDVDRERAMDAGFDAYIKKPMTGQRLIEAVGELAAVAADDAPQA